MNRQVPGFGPSNANIMIIGEAPGSTEIAGLPLRDIPPSPFIGWSGEFLQEMCTRAGIDWKSIRRDNVVQFQPPKNDFSIFYQYSGKGKASIGYSTGELLKWHEDLKERILEVKPKVIIAAGDHTLFALTGHRSSTQWRGSVIPYSIEDHSCFIVPIVHPSYARRCYNMTSAKQKDLRQPWFYISVYDLKKAKRISEEGWNPLERTEETFPTFDRVMEYLEELYAMPSDTLIITDVETIRREHIKCVGLTHRKDYAMCIPLVSNGNGTAYYNINQEAEIWKMIDRVYNTHHMGNQTIDFDHAQFWRDVGMDFVDSIYLDTAVLHSILYPELNHDLGFLASLYTDMQYFKYLGRMSEAKYNIAQMFTYNCYDCQSTYEIAENLIEEAKREGMWDYYLTKRLPLLKWAVRQHMHGLSVDNIRRPEIGKRIWNEDIKPKQVALNEALVESGYPMQNTKPNKTLLEKFETLGIDETPDVDVVNVRSPLQVIELLRALGYSLTSSDEETLKGLEENHGSVVAGTIRDLRSDYALLGSISKPEDEDGKFRTTIKLYVTETTRLSSTKSHFNTGCLLPQAEIYTRNGWIPFEQISLPEIEALIWNTKELFFAPCKVLQFPYMGSMYKANATFHKNVYTTNHRIPTYTSRLSNLTVYDAQTLSTKERLRIPIAAPYKQGTINIPYIRLLVAAMADGDVSSNSVLRFQFTKQRKIDRMFMLANNLGCTVQDDMANHNQQFTIRGTCIPHILTYCKLFNKRFQTDLWKFDYGTLCTIIDELPHWDSHIRGKSFIFSTVRKELAEQIMLIAHLTGKFSASLQINYDNNRGYGSGNNQLLYIVNIKPRWYLDHDTKYWEKIDYRGDVYCLETPTGFFLTRYNGAIMITGNSNMQNVTKRARPLFCGSEE